MKITIGIPCYRDVPGEVLSDYMRMTYYLGKHSEHEYFLGVKTKSEQFRARNAIVEGALQTGSDYILMIDDDHVIAWEDGFETVERYGFVDTLVKHMEDNSEMGVCGVLYYHRGGDCLPVLMKEGKDGGYYYMREDQIKHELQEVDVQGGGCMLLKTEMFDKIPYPWFEPETELGTDLQISTKAKKYGYKVFSDTSIVIGHIKSTREVVTPKNRNRIMAESQSRGLMDKPQFDPNKGARDALQLYKMDAEEFLGVDWDMIGHLAASYQYDVLPKFKDFDDPKDYYRQLGAEQLARQVYFHCNYEETITNMEMFLQVVDTNLGGYGLDFGCGSAPVGFEFLMRGHKMDFVDLDGATAYEFTKWRAKKYNKECGFELRGPYDYILMFDSIEHIKDWEETLDKVTSLLKEDGALLTNYFLNRDFNNPEHISMDHKSVQDYLLSKGLHPINECIWLKRDLSFMDKIA